jgi:hypothetical protein
VLERRARLAVVQLFATTRHERSPSKSNRIEVERRYQTAEHGYGALLRRRLDATLLRGARAIRVSFRLDVLFMSRNTSNRSYQRIDDDGDAARARNRTLHAIRVSHINIVSNRPIQELHSPTSLIARLLTRPSASPQTRSSASSARGTILPSSRSRCV